jgi:CheY-like chemotaxis protein
MGSDASKYVLLVDDDKVLSREWQLAFEQRGYKTSVCHRIDNAMVACEHLWPDAVVVDAFFRDENGVPTGSGGLLFCTQLSIYAQANELELPFVVGVTGSRPSQYFPVDVFGQVSGKIMPVRLKKPLAASTLVDAIDAGLS